MSLAHNAKFNKSCPQHDKLVLSTKHHNDYKMHSGQQPRSQGPWERG